MSDFKRERMNEAAARANAAAEGVALGVGAGALTLGALMMREGAEAARVAEQQRQASEQPQALTDGVQHSAGGELVGSLQPAEFSRDAIAASEPAQAAVADASAISQADTTPIKIADLVHADNGGALASMASESGAGATTGASSGGETMTPIGASSDASSSLADRIGDFTPVNLDQAMQSLHTTTDALGTAIQSSVAATLQSVTSSLDGVTGNLAQATDGLGETISSLTAGALAPATDIADGVVETAAAAPDLATDLFEGLSGDFARTIELGFIGQPLGAGDGPHDLPMSTLHDLHHGLI